ncbi:MAG TPA: hypothetical protein VIK78_19855 [Ruminiclostridium sp.]
MSDIDEIEKAIKVLKGAKSFQTKQAKRVELYDMSGYLNAVECIDALTVAIKALEEKQARDKQDAFLSRVGAMCTHCGECKGGTNESSKSKQHRLRCTINQGIDNWDCYNDCTFWNGLKCNQYESGVINGL